MDPELEKCFNDIYKHASWNFESTPDQKILDQCIVTIKKHFPQLWDQEITEEDFAFRELYGIKDDFPLICYTRCVQMIILLAEKRKDYRLMASTKQYLPAIFFMAADDHSSLYQLFLRAPMPETLEDYCEYRNIPDNMKKIFFRHEKWELQYTYCRELVKELIEYQAEGKNYRDLVPRSFIDRF